MQAHALAVHAVYDEIEAETPVQLGQLELPRVGFGTIDEAALKARDAIAHKGPSMRQRAQVVFPIEDQRRSMVEHGDTVRQTVCDVD